jgi:hypothetical protein
MEMSIRKEYSIIYFTCPRRVLLSSMSLTARLPALSLFPTVRQVVGDSLPSNRLNKLYCHRGHIWYVYQVTAGFRISGLP